MCVRRFFLSICDISSLRLATTSERTKTAKKDRFSGDLLFSTETDLFTTHFSLAFSSLRFNWNLFSALDSIQSLLTLLTMLKNWNIFSSLLQLHCHRSLAFFLWRAKKKIISIVCEERQVVKCLLCSSFATRLVFPLWITVASTRKNWDAWNVSLCCIGCGLFEAWCDENEIESWGWGIAVLELGLRESVEWNFEKCNFEESSLRWGCEM